MLQSQPSGRGQRVMSDIHSIPLNFTTNPQTSTLSPVRDFAHAVPSTPNLLPNFDNSCSSLQVSGETSLHSESFPALPRQLIC